MSSSLTCWRSRQSTLRLASLSLGWPLVTLLLVAHPVFGQETEPATPAELAAAAPPAGVIGEPPGGLGSPLFPNLPPVRSAEDVAPTGPAGSSLADARNIVADDAPLLTLTDAIVLSIENNPQRDAALAALRAAEARVGIAKSAGGLQLGWNGSADYQRSFGGSGRTVVTDPGTGVPPGGGVDRSSSGNGFSQSLGVSADLPIYNGGRVKAGRRAAEAGTRAQAAQTLQIEQTLVQSTISSYLNVLRTSQLLQVAESDLAVSRERRRVAGLRYIAGAGARLEVLQANTQLAEAQQRRISASNALAQAKAALNILMGRAPETPVRVADVTVLTPRVPLPAGVGDTLQIEPGESGSDVPIPSVPPAAGSESLREIADQANPTLAANRAQVEAALAQLDVAKAGKKPNLGLSLTGLLRNPVAFTGRFLLSVGLGIAQTLFDSGRTSSQVREARALIEQASGNLDLQRLNVANQIESSLLTLDSAAKRLRSADIAVEEAREQLNAAQIGYEAGVQTSLDVSAAQSALLQAQTEAANARFDVANAQSNLAAAVGVLTAEGQAAYEQALQEETARQEARTAEIKAAEPVKKRRKFLGIF